MASQPNDIDDGLKKRKRANDDERLTSHVMASKKIKDDKNPISILNIAAKRAGEARPKYDFHPDNTKRTLWNAELQVFDCTFQIWEYHHSKDDAKLAVATAAFSYLQRRETTGLKSEEFKMGLTELQRYFGNHPLCFLPTPEALTNLFSTSRSSATTPVPIATLTDAENLQISIRPDNSIEFAFTKPRPGTRFQPLTAARATKVFEFVVDAITKPFHNAPPEHREEMALRIPQTAICASIVWNSIEPERLNLEVTAIDSPMSIHISIKPPCSVPYPQPSLHWALNGLDTIIYMLLCGYRDAPDNIKDGLVALVSHRARENLGFPHDNTVAHNENDRTQDIASSDLATVDVKGEHGINERSVTPQNESTLEIEEAPTLDQFSPQSHGTSNKINGTDPSIESENVSGNLGTAEPLESLTRERPSNSTLETSIPDTKSCTKTTTIIDGPAMLVPETKVEIERSSRNPVTATSSSIVLPVKSTEPASEEEAGAFQEPTTESVNGPLVESVSESVEPPNNLGYATQSLEKNEIQNDSAETLPDDSTFVVPDTFELEKESRNEHAAPNMVESREDSTELGNGTVPEVSPSSRQLGHSASLSVPANSGPQVSYSNDPFAERLKEKAVNSLIVTFRALAIKTTNFPSPAQAHTVAMQPKYDVSQAQQATHEEMSYLEDADCTILDKEQGSFLDNAGGSAGQDTPSETSESHTVGLSGFAPDSGDDEGESDKENGGTNSSAADLDIDMDRGNDDSVSCESETQNTGDLSDGETTAKIKSPSTSPTSNTPSAASFGASIPPPVKIDVSTSENEGEDEEDERNSPNPVQSNPSPTPLSNFSPPISESPTTGASSTAPSSFSAPVRTSATTGTSLSFDLTGSMTSANLNRAYSEDEADNEQSDDELSRKRANRSGSRKEKSSKLSKSEGPPSKKRRT